MSNLCWQGGYLTDKFKTKRCAICLSLHFNHPIPGKVKLQRMYHKKFELSKYKMDTEITINEALSLKELTS
jgi:hypothetical protein